VSRVRDTKAAKRYASALFQAARKLCRIDAVERDLNALGSLIESAPLFQRALESPLVPGDRKRALVDRILAGDVDDLTRRFLYLLIDKRREEILPAVRIEFSRQADNARGLVRAEALVAAPLDEAQVAELVCGLEQRTGKRVELSVRVDPAVIGGVMVRLEDTVIDGSVRGALERLREQMLRQYAVA